MGHHVRLHLRHEVHGHDNDDQERSAAKIERDIPLQDQELRQQTDQADVNRANQRQTQNDAFDVARSLLTLKGWAG